MSKYDVIDVTTSQVIVYGAVEVREGVNNTLQATDEDENIYLIPCDTIILLRLVTEEDV